MGSPIRRCSPRFQQRGADSLVAQPSTHLDGPRRWRVRRASISWSPSMLTAARSRTGRRRETHLAADCGFAGWCRRRTRRGARCRHLHRDVKPANILVARNGYAKLADFGLAKLEERPHRPTSRELQPGPHPARNIVGSIAYMSPEQASGRPLDARSDIFSFGMVLYEILTGHRPFGGASNLEVLQQIMHGAPAPLPGDTPPRFGRSSRRRSSAIPQTVTSPCARSLSTCDVFATGRCGRGREGTRGGAGARNDPAMAVGRGGVRRDSALAAAGGVWQWRRPAGSRQSIGECDVHAFHRLRGRGTGCRNLPRRAIRRLSIGPPWTDGHLGQSSGHNRFLNITHGARPSVLVRNAGLTPDGADIGCRRCRVAIGCGWCRPWRRPAALPITP